MTASPTEDLASAERRIQELTKELLEAREQQAATAGILAAISSSLADLQRAFAEIAASAARLCDAHDATIFQVNGDGLRIVAHSGPIPPGGTLPLTRSIVTGCAVLDRRPIHVADLQAEPDKYPEGSDRARLLGHRTILAVPLIHAGKAIGTIAIRRTEVHPFTDRQIDLLKTFADQAVIAIENTRLFNEVKDSLERQTATAEILKVISSSPTDLPRVMATLAQSAASVCAASDALIYCIEGDRLRIVASYGSVGTTAAARTQGLALVRTTVTGRAFLDRKTVHVADLAASLETEFPDSRPYQSELGFRTTLATPLLSKGTSIGAILIRRMVVDPFSDKQVTMLETFADQAVIAIENARLFEAEEASKRELTEALEQQTATADVLKVISRSALDLRRALDALVQSAARLCNAYDAVIFQVFGDGMRLVAHHGQIPLAGPLQQHIVPLVPGLIAARAIIDRRTIHVADALLADADGFFESRKNALQQGFRTVLAVPLVHAGEAIGVILIRRAEVRPFTERQIELVNTFADQAVIAIENTRLFDEVQARTRELA